MAKLNGKPVKVKDGHNVIPRTFIRITGECLVETSMSRIGDELHIYKNDCGSGYLALNLRTQKYSYMFASMLRNADVFRIKEILT